MIDLILNLLSYHLYFKPHLSHLGFEYCARRFADSFCRDIKTKNNFELMGVLKDGFCFKRRLRTVNFHGKESLSPVNKRLSVEAAGSQVWRWEGRQSRCRLVLSSINALFYVPRYRWMNSYARNLSQLIFLLKIALAPFPDNLWRTGTDDDQCTK